MEILFNWIGGATFILSIGNLKIAVDPVLCEKGTVQDFFWFKSKRIESPVYSDSDFEKIDLWLITHRHEDHLDKTGLSKISDSSIIICNKDSYNVLKQTGSSDITVLRWKQVTKINLREYQIEIEAIPAIHGVNPLSAWLAGNVNGYYLTVTNEKESIRIYITGDTVFKNRIIQALQNKKIDILIPNMGAAKQGSLIMTLTLNSKMLQKIISALNPGMVVPVHYAAFEHYKEPVEKIRNLNDQRIKIIETGVETVLYSS